MKELRIIPEVAEDVASAADWYDHEGYAGLGDRFIATFESYASHLQKMEEYTDQFTWNFEGFYSGRFHTSCIIDTMARFWWLCWLFTGLGIRNLCVHYYVKGNFEMPNKTVERMPGLHLRRVHSVFVPASVSLLLAPKVPLRS